MPSAPAPLTRRRFWRPRFSLRALLIVMTLLCLVFAPVLPELNRARNVARQVKIIEEMGGQCVFVDRPRSFAAGLLQRVWPVRIEHLDHDLLMAEFNAQTVDLAKLRQTPDVRGVCFNECLFVLPEDEPDVLLPRIEYVQLQERDDVKGGKPDPAIMRRFPAFFPNLRKAQLMGVAQRQTFVDALADCTHLEDLDLWFRTGEDESVDTRRLGQLWQLRRLRLSGVTGPWNWTFLIDLKNLEEVELGSKQQHVGTDLGPPPARPGHIVAPSQALAGAQRLKSLALYERGEWQQQLEVIAQNNDLRSVRLPDRWPAIDALQAVRSESQLQKISNLQIAGDGYDVFAALRGFPELRELEVNFTELTDHDLHALSELKSVESIIFHFDPYRGNVSDEGIALFKELPIKDVGSRYSFGQPLGEGMQRLVDSWPGPGSGKPFRQTDEGLQFLLRDAQQ